MTSKLLVVDHVNFSFHKDNARRDVLKDISFSLEEGNSLSIMGPSGIGKTTLCRIVSGLIRPTSGSITFEGQPVTKPSSSITISFQHYPCFPWLSVEKNVMFGVHETNPSDFAAEQEYALWLLKQVGLSDVRKSSPRELSGGMLQRLSIARSLAVRPKTLILDEPFSALDARTKTDLKDLILNLQERAHFSFIAVLHNLEDAYSFTDRTIVLDGTPASVLLDIDIRGLRFTEFHERVINAMGESNRQAKYLKNLGRQDLTKSSLAKGLVT
jgi:NitT/TauT family transport system ATP-binding protein